MYIEKVNPNHVGIIWGKRRKDLNKGTHYVKCGKVFFTIVPVAYGLSVLGWLDAFTFYAHDLLIQMGICGIILGGIMSVIVYGIPIWMSRRSPYGIRP